MKWISPITMRLFAGALVLGVLTGPMAPGWGQYSPPMSGYDTSLPGSGDPYGGGQPTAPGVMPGTFPDGTQGVSPFSTPGGGGGDPSASFGGLPGAATYADPFAPAGTTPDTAMLSWSPASAVAGFKYGYSSQFGDYFNLQSKSGRWATFPVTVYLTLPEDMNDEDKAAVKSAVSAWQKVVDLTLVDQPDQAKIEITWVSDLADGEDLGESEFIATHVDSFGRTINDKAVVRMLEPNQYVGVYPNVLKSALMHQLGHALGINSHSDNLHDLMAEPSYKRQKNPILKKTLQSLASKTLGQFIDLPNTSANTTRRKVVTPPLEKISKRDLNTLYRLYN